MSKSMAISSQGRHLKYKAPENNCNICCCGPCQSCQPFASVVYYILTSGNSLSAIVQVQIFCLVFIDYSLNICVPYLLPFRSGQTWNFKSYSSLKCILPSFLVTSDVIGTKQITLCQEGINLRLSAS